MTDQVTFKMKCAACLTPISWDADLNDDAPIACQSCGDTVGTLADFKRIAREATSKLAMEIARKAFKR